MPGTAGHDHGFLTTIFDHARLQSCDACPFNL
jgi:hypothetical protein